VVKDMLEVTGSLRSLEENGGRATAGDLEAPGRDLQRGGGGRGAWRGTACSGEA